MLAVVFRAERFHTYIYGWSFMIESDHKLFESISRKNLADTPAWLQHMMPCLQGYNLTIHYSSRQWNGHTRHALSIQSPARPQPSIGYCYPPCLHNARPTKKLSSKPPSVIEKCKLLPTSSLLAGPRTSRKFLVPSVLYWQHRETLTIEDGLVLQGEALVIPPAKREQVLHQLHQFHQGITKSQLLTCGSFFWPSINKAIEEVVCQCETCTWFQSQNAAVPLTPTPTPSHPWQMCATDIFMLEGVDHLVVGNFYLKMLFVWCLPPGQNNTNKVILLLKEMFSEHGIPKVLHSDNGPQYVSAQFTDFCLSWGITHETSSLHYPQSKWICQGMHQVCQTRTPISQIQQCWSTSCLTSTTSHTHWHQAPISSRAVVPMPTQNNHSSQDTQQWPISHTSPWADWYMLWNC